jgi:hypothetical protein
MSRGAYTYSSPCTIRGTLRCVPTEPSPASPDLRDACEALKSAHREVVQIIEGTPDHQQAFESASLYRELAEDLAQQAADLRAAMAARIWEAESLSLTSLAARVGVSKSRAAQFIRAARGNDEPKE